MWDENFSADHYIYGTEPNGFLKENVDTLPQGKILCLAEGEGRNAVYLAKLGYDVTAVDGSIVGLTKAKKLANENNVDITWIHEDLATFELGENCWDGIVSIFCHIPAEIRVTLHQKIAASLRPNGVFLLEAYIPAQLKHDTGGPPTEELMMSKDELALELAGLKFLRLEEVKRVIVEGTKHTGLAAVVQVVGSREVT